MQKLMEWITSMEWGGVEIVSLVLFGVYILACSIGFVVTFMMGRGYLDLARGLRRILERNEQEGKLGQIESLSVEISIYYESYAKYNPTVTRHYASILNWMDDVLLQTNMFKNEKSKKKKKKYSIWFDEYYDVLKAVQQYYENCHPFYRCTSGQAQILEDISGLKTKENMIAVDNLLKKTEEEFVRLTNDGKKNERTNYISIAIGVAGILVSLLLTLLQMVG